jgi:transmembrane sensor
MSIKFSIEMSESQQLFNKYINNQCSPEEVEALMMYFHTDEQEELNRLILQELEQPDNDSNNRDYEPLLNSVYKDIQAKIHKDVQVSRPLWYRIAAAASILLVLSAGGYFLVHKTTPAQIAQNQIHDVKPGTNKATLTLSNGQKIVLTTTLSGKLAQQGNTNVIMTSGGEITYTQKEAAQTQIAEVAYNTLTTKRKEQFPLVLADGTKVWLNSSSSITYPVTFNGRERRVSITGEAYFEVVHNAAQPFRVAVSGQTVEDIGTEFNINAYDDEPVIKTTLINGSVKVSKNGKTAILKPGQQSTIHPINNSIIVSDADVEEATAWKNGLTLFNDEDIQTIMRQVSRWYDVDVVYEGKIPNRHFEGGISRKSNLSSLLKILELNNIHFTVENHKIIIKP